MRSQADRDAVTIEISTALSIFVLVVAAGAVPLFLVANVVGESPLLRP